MDHSLRLRTRRRTALAVLLVPDLLAVMGVGDRSSRTAPTELIVYTTHWPEVEGSSK